METHWNSRVSEDRLSRLRELRERSEQRRHRIQELRQQCQVLQRDKQCTAEELEASTHILAMEEERLERDQMDLTTLLSFQVFPDYLDRAAEEFASQVQEREEEEDKSSCKVDDFVQLSPEGSLDGSAPDTVDASFVAILEQSSFVTVEDSEPSPSVLSRAVGGVVSLLTPSYWSAAEPPQLRECEFLCLHTNWYGRRLQRKFRFCSDCFIRMIPESCEVRQVYRYEDISKVIVKSPTNFVIEYNNNKFPADWLETTPTTAKQILDLLVSRVNDLRVERD